MRKTITTRHCDIPDTLRERADVILERFASVAHRPTGADLVFDVLHGRPAVEARVHLRGSEPVVARAEAEDHRSALDRVVDKMRRQLNRAGKRPLRQRAAAPERV